MRGKKFTTNGVQESVRPIFVALLGSVLVAVGGYFLYQRQNANNLNSDVSESVAPEETPQPKQPEVTVVKGKYMFSGTIVLARAVENEAKRSDGTVDYAQPFSKFDTFNPEQYDGWLADIECPVTTNYIPYRTQVANTVFNCPPEFIPELKKYITIANVANNHTRDQGDEGFSETVRHLEEGGIQTVGHWDPREIDDICEVISLPVRLQKDDGKEEQGTLPMAFCAWHYFQKDPAPGEIEEAAKYAEIMPVFAFMQVGVEYRDSADPRQVEFGRKIIDQGSEFLIGNSPHWVQNTENYKGKLIVYSTGNFIFDQLDAETNRGLSISADMTIPYDENVQAWLDLGKTCEPRGDNCFKLAKDLGLKKVDIDLVFDAIGSSGGYTHLTQLATPDLQAAIEARANWKTTLEGLTN